jgi:hypothetical protein
MKGMVFTEFLEMVESKFSAHMVDDIIEEANLPHGGAYTSVGAYDHSELVTLVSALSKRTDIAVPSLVHAFGEHLFVRFTQLFPRFFVEVTSAMDFLEGIEGVIHPEVRKLYPDAQLPSFVCTRSSNGLEMVYSSPRHFGDLAEGLIQGAVKHFGEAIQVSRTNRLNGEVLFQLLKLS